jgi:hypothetical protein
MPEIDNKQFRGRKARIGSVAFDKNGSVCLVAGYCPCCNSKILWSPDEMRQFVQRWGRQRKRPTNRFLMAALEKRAV